MVETKNKDSLHFCTTEIYIPQEYFQMCYIRRQLMFCCDHVVDDVRGWHMTSWKLEFIILPRPSFGARCPRQGLSPGLYLCWGSVRWIWFGWLPKPDEKILLIPFRVLSHQSNLYRGHHSAQHVLLLLILNLQRWICVQRDASPISYRIHRYRMRYNLYSWVGKPLLIDLQSLFCPWVKQEFVWESGMVWR